MSESDPGWFEGSRRLTGPNRDFDAPGALLEVVETTSALCAGWEARVRAMCAALGWPAPRVAIRLFASGASLAFTAPVDQLLSATDVAEWAWQAAVTGGDATPPDLSQPSHPPLPLAPAAPAAWDALLALETLQRLAHAEARPRELALRAEAARRGITCLVDDEMLSLGAGSGNRAWPLAALPAPEAVPWVQLHDVPVALVTGSNGKTTSVRLVAAMLSAGGRPAGFNCTDGVFVGGQPIEHGDWSGPAGARAVLRDLRVQAAVLEVARGGLLRRGLAVDRADAALVTNVSADHFGEYGVDDLDALAEAKLVVARAIDARGRLVLNADDPVLLRRADAVGVPLAWFAQDAGNRRLETARARGEPTCAPSGGRLRLCDAAGGVHDLGAVRDMPLTLSGAAGYNIANLAGAALMAHVLGVESPTIAAVCARFGLDHQDNPGRLERWRIHGAEVLLDYAHNPDGLRGLLGVADRLRAPGGRLLLLLGQAGNREDAAIAELGAVAAAAKPALVCLKDIVGYMRGREPGEVAALLADALVRGGVPRGAIRVELDEAAAARGLVDEAQAGDVVVLPIHNLEARGAVAAWLDGRADATGR